MISQNKPTIAIDMDGVLADVESHYIDWYEQEYGVRVPRENMLGVPEGDAFPIKDAIRKFLVTPGFFSSAPVMPGAIDAIQVLQKLFDIYIVSAAMEFPQSLIEKREWLQEHFPSINWRNIVFCGDKRVIDTDFMIDDHCKNLDHFKGKPIMFTASHNIAYTHHTRVNNWEEALSYLETAAGSFRLETLDGVGHGRA